MDSGPLAALLAGDVGTAAAVALLYRHTDSGVQGYVCKMLRRCPSWEVEYYLPQLCHLMVSRPRESVSLQAFLVELCTHSMHSAVCVLWILDAYLEDLRADSVNPAFAMCLQLYRQCQTILFSDARPRSATLPSGSPAPSSVPLSAEPASVASPPQPPAPASAPADVSVPPAGDANSSSAVSTPQRAPSLSPSTSATQLRRHVVKGSTPAIAMGMGVIMAAFAMPQLLHTLGDVILEHSRSREYLDEGERPADEERRVSSPVTVPVANGASIPFPTRPLTVQEMHGGRAFSFDQFVKLSAADPLSDSGSSIVSSDYTQRLLNPHYFYSELQFIMTLVDIGDRLVSVPKEAREATLHAELNLLSHNLPARVCIPLWCPATREHSVHHHVVRIAPEEAVVLNSKARVPYLIHVEVLDASDPPLGVPPPDFEDLSVLQEKTPVMPAASESSSSEDNGGATSPRRNGHSSRGPLSDHVIKHPADASSLGNGGLSEQSLLDEEDMADTLSRAAAQPDMGQHRSSVDVDVAGQAEQIRTASVMLAQLSLQDSTSGSRPETTAIRNKILRELKGLQSDRLLMKRQRFDVDGPMVALQKNENDPSAYLFQEDFDLKTERIRRSSPYGHHASWRLLSLIVKCRDDLRQEQLACQVIAEFKRIWAAAGLPLFVYPFRVLVTSQNSGLVETIPNAVSIHSIKNSAYKSKLPFAGSEYTLRDHFIQEFGPPESQRFAAAQNRFAASLAGYSIVCYLLQIKDRHDGNILLDREGRLIHIDYGFMLASSPGGVGFETAPFKLSQEYVDVLGGSESDAFDKFQMLLLEGFLALRRHADSLVLLIEIMQRASKLPCFNKSGENTAVLFRERFQLHLADAAVGDFVGGLTVAALGNVNTALYDQYQYYTNGIL